jgi:hypothetical protein
VFLAPLTRAHDADPAKRGGADHFREGVDQETGLQFGATQNEIRHDEAGAHHRSPRRHVEIGKIVSGRGIDTPDLERVDPGFPVRVRGCLVQQNVMSEIRW